MTHQSSETSTLEMLMQMAFPLYSGRLTDIKKGAEQCGVSVESLPAQKHSQTLEIVLR